jgi:hypothetical protein
LKTNEEIRKSIRRGGFKMKRKQLAIKILGLIFCLMIGLHWSLVYSAEPIPTGSTLPAFQLKGSPEAKAYLGLMDEKSFSLSQVKTKLVMVEFIDVF